MMQTYVAFSGGKDSTALALVMPDAIPIFNDTGWEFPDIYAHLDKFEQVTGREVIRVTANQTLPEYIEKAKFMPGHGSRYCTRMFKIEPLNTFLSDQNATVCIGLRADEPESLRIGNLTEAPNLTFRYPLREMNMGIYDVIRKCLEYDLLPRRLPYMARGGCKGCFYKRKQEVVAMHYLTPDTLDELQALEESVQDERGQFAYMFPNMNMSIRELRHQLDQQPMLFDIDEVYQQAADTSDVGQACGAFCGR